MEVTAIIAILEAAADLASKGYTLYEQSQTTLSDTDKQQVHEALLKAEMATAQMRPLVDAALEEAANK